ncbi:Oidioi.mRNA.OKI2018_I69.chr2.g6703.t1.cds [Oikopleura dioica]|uniref:Oidioi.mRNA.OKI2018_I69.chr2.g6703.t1.cds n=1 Tax=Oikopleura dioica TaxID=34765 RepID=A0ABN7T3U9_OIKDI|nr:Oidioi.mRNA.OKI2018_I69.chr2.g6703.t1.cds [Oikopleura dioica]
MVKKLGTITDIDTKSYYLVVDRQSFVVKDKALKKAKVAKHENEPTLNITTKKLNLMTKASEFDEYLVIKTPGSKKLSVKRAYVHSLRPRPTDSQDDGQTTTIRRDNYREAKFRVQEELGGARQKRILAERKKEKQIFDHGQALEASKEAINAPLPKLVKRLGSKRH